jgi:hypothetical protein
MDNNQDANTPERSRERSAQQHSDTENAAEAGKRDSTHSSESSRAGNNPNDNKRNENNANGNNRGANGGDSGHRTSESDASAFDREGHSPASRPLASLFADLARDASRLVSKEAELAKAEVSENTSKAISGVVFIVVSAAVLLAGLVILLESAVYGISQFLPPDMVPWLSALIVGGVVTVIGLVLLMKGRSNLKAKNLMPDRTIDSVQRDSNLAREHTR